MPVFHAEGDDAAQRRLNLARVVADAKANGYAVETVWILTDLPGSVVRIPPTPADGPVSVPVHAARAPRGTHDWGAYDVGEGLYDQFDQGLRYHGGESLRIRECQVSHAGAACPPGPCQHPERP